QRRNNTNCATMGKIAARMPYQCAGIRILGLRRLAAAFLPPTICRTLQKPKLRGGPKLPEKRERAPAPQGKTQRKAPGRVARVEPRPEPREEKKPPVLREALLRTLRS